MNLAPMSSIYNNSTEQFSSSIYSNIFYGTPYRGDVKPSQYTVEIIPTMGSITMQSIRGLLTSDPEIETNATWEASDLLNVTMGALGPINSVYKFAKTAMGLGGYADPSNLGASSKKIYQTSGYLSFGIGMRVVDWDGTGEATKASYLAHMLSLPFDATGMSQGELANLVIDAALKGVLGPIDKNVANSVVEFKNKIAGGIGKTVEGLINAAPEILKPTLKTVLDEKEFFILAKSPRTITVKLGDYFERGDMIIESVSSKFPMDKMTDAGPLYVDLSIRVSSRQTLALSKDKKLNSNLGLKIPTQFKL